MSYLTEAFKQMELLESEQFTFDKNGAAKLANFLEDDMLNDFEAIIDPEAETKEEVKDSYMGDVICRCCICKSLIYRNPEEIVVDEEAQLANIEDECPFCFEVGGYEIVGQVAPYEEVTVEAEGDVDIKVDGKDVDSNSVDEEPEEETLKESTNIEKLYKTFPELKSNGVEGRSRRHTRDNEDIEDCQRFPVEGTKQVNLMERRCAKKRHTRDNEDLEDSQRYPIESPAPAQTGLAMMENKELEEDTSIRAKLKRAFPQLDFDKKNESLKEGMEEAYHDDDGKGRGFVVYADSKVVDKILDEIQPQGGNRSEAEIIADALAESCYKYNGNKKYTMTNYRIDMKDTDDFLLNIDFYLKKFPVALELFKKYFSDKLVESTTLREGMEDISITTDDQVIKVKATPRADKETIQPIEDETKDIIETPAEEEAVEGEEMVELDELDEASFDSLGESYLKEVYENVKSFKTSKVRSQNNNIIMEGIIAFNSGKKVKTQFIFEAKEATKSGKLKFSGLNENITKNKNAFTLTGSLVNNKLILESLNYNYSAKAEDGKSKRLYGTVKVK